MLLMLATASFSGGTTRSHISCHCLVSTSAASPSSTVPQRAQEACMLEVSFYYSPIERLKEGDHNHRRNCLPKQTRWERIKYLDEACASVVKPFMWFGNIFQARSQITEVVRVLHWQINGDEGLHSSLKLNAWWTWACREEEWAHGTKLQT